MKISYATQYDLQPKGTFRNWWQMYLDEVKGNLLLELAVIFGVSSLVTAYLKTYMKLSFPVPSIVSEVNPLQVRLQLLL